jgi:hypothetical protein
MEQERGRPSWVAISGLVSATAGLVIAIFAVGLSVYRWNSEVNSTISAAIEISTKNIQDSGLDKVRSDYLDWLHGKGTDYNMDQKIFAAQTYVLYLDYVAQLINTKRVHPDYVSSLLKCELVDNFRNLYEKDTPSDILPKKDKIMHLVEYNRNNQGAECRLITRY